MFSVDNIKRFSVYTRVLYFWVSFRKLRPFGMRLCISIYIWLIRHTPTHQKKKYVAACALFETPQKYENLRHLRCSYRQITENQSIREKPKALMEWDFNKTQTRPTSYQSTISESIQVSCSPLLLPSNSTPTPFPRVLHVVRYELERIFIVFARLNGEKMDGWRLQQQKTCNFVYAGYCVLAKYA